MVILPSCHVSEALKLVSCTNGRSASRRSAGDGGKIHVDKKEGNKLYVVKATKSASDLFDGVP